MDRGGDETIKSKWGGREWDEEKMRRMSLSHPPLKTKIPRYVSVNRPLSKYSICSMKSWEIPASSQLGHNYSCFVGSATK